MIILPAGKQGAHHPAHLVRNQEGYPCD